MEINFDKMQGLAPAVIQDAATGELLMVGFMSREALETTLRTGFVTFYSSPHPMSSATIARSRLSRRLEDGDSRSRVLD